MEEANTIQQRRLVASISQQGVAIGRCLRDALRSLESPEEDNERESPTKRQKVKIDSGMIDQTMQTFGESVADTQLASAHVKATSTAPRAILEGRVDHYNRIGQNWRILVKNAKLKEKAPTNQERKKTKASLSRAKEVTHEKFQIDSVGLQILAFNDK